MWNNTYLNTGGALVFLILSLIITSCGKDKYYIDGGTVNPVYKGTTLQFLESKPDQFDSIVTVIKLAKLEKVFADESITFFAPTDNSIKRAMELSNSFLYQLGKDSVRTLDDVSPEIWRKYLLRYVFRGANKLNDYYQIDFELKNVFPGQNYYSYNNSLFNIGVVYNDVTYTDDIGGSVKGIKYAGYRQIELSYIEDLDDPENHLKWLRTTVTSSDHQTSNGVVHVLINLHTFGLGDFYGDVYASK